jgi:hypothetical protein
MNIEFTIDDLTTHAQTASARRFAYWILLIGVLSGGGALALAAAVTR